MYGGPWWKTDQQLLLVSRVLFLSHFTCGLLLLNLLCAVSFGFSVAWIRSAVGCYGFEVYRA